MTGHLLGAAGAIDAISCILSINNNVVPPTINHFNKDPEIDPEKQVLLMPWGFGPRGWFATRHRVADQAGRRQWPRDR